MNEFSESVNKDYDLICVGGGIMSATLALLAKLTEAKFKDINSRAIR